MGLFDNFKKAEVWRSFENPNAPVSFVGKVI